MLKVKPFPEPSRNSLDGEIIRIARGVAIYKTHASPFWFARIWDRQNKRYTVKSTKETARVKARTAAEELAADLMNGAKLVPKDFMFKRFAQLFLDKGRRLVETGERNANYMRTARLFLDNDEWGLLRRFGHLDVRELTTRDFNAFMTDLEARRSDLSPSSRNMLC